MVPSCRMPQSQRKLDKSTILKLTVSYMKLHADLLPDTLDESTMSWKPSFMSNEELGQLMLEVRTNEYTDKHTDKLTDSTSIQS